jgi:ribosomal protein L29
MSSPILPLAKLHLSASTALGAEEADILIAHLPPVPLSDLATKDDLGVLSRELSGEMAVLRSELRGEMAVLRSELRGEMAELRTELRGEMAELRTELRTGLAGLRTEMAEARHASHVEVLELRGDLYRVVNTQTWRLVTAMAAINAIISATIVALR